MDLIINEKQLKHLISNGFGNQEIKEQDVDPTAAQPTAGPGAHTEGCRPVCGRPDRGWRYS